MTYVLDSSVLIPIQQAGHAATLQACGKLPVVVTGIVWDELTANIRAKRPADADAAEKMLATIAGKRTELLPTSPEGISVGRVQLRSRMDAGESETIAFAFHDRDKVAVLEDVVAVREAVEHLQGRDRECRVLGIHGFLKVLVSNQGLPKSSALKISNDFITRKGLASYQAPLWWPANLEAGVTQARIFSRSDKLPWCVVTKRNRRKGDRPRRPFHAASRVASGGPTEAAKPRCSLPNRPT